MRFADSGARAMYFDFTHINWERINFSTDDTPRTIGGKIKIKKVDKVAFSLRNEQLNRAIRDLLPCNGIHRKR